MCRNPISVIFMEFDKDQNPDLSKKIRRYNKKYVDKRSLVTILKEMPFLLKKWLRYISNFRNLINNKTEIIYFVFSLLYLISPIDLLPEAILGVIGLLDDAAIIGVA
mmetsp:Transcript_11865/g.13410  ORF Transcript_11865/g.13410 Transcript_11865/m.13410 type:complete len:107 (+) Transcript_11865:284-604(+)